MFSGVSIGGLFSLDTADDCDNNDEKDSTKGNRQHDGEFLAFGI